MTAATLLATACADGGKDSDGDQGASPSGGTPVAGGTLTFAEYATPNGLDPIINIGGGTNGMIETSAIFDTLLRYNHDTGGYDPGTAESVEPNADATEWTIKLHPGITFSDGTAYDAEAVAFNLNRARAGRPDGPACDTVWACPSNSSTSSYPASFIKDITVLDATSLRVTLHRAWPTFRIALATELGLVPSPTAVKKCDAKAPASQCAFNTTPVGAGPFTVTAFKPGEALTMARNPDYWGGDVYLDGLRFIDLKDGGGLTSLNAVKSDQAQAAFLRDQAAVAQAHADEMPGLAGPQYAGSVLRFNLTPGVPTADIRVRHAVALAVDPTVINDRAYDGKGTPSNEFLPASFRYSPQVPAPKIDVDAAKKLVAEAKADGWDGRIRVTSSNAPAATNIALAIQAMLQNIGMTVTLDSGQDPTATTAKLFKFDYELLVSGLGFFNDDSVGHTFASYYTSNIATNRNRIADPGLDAALSDVIAADTDAEKKAAFGDVVRLLDDLRPDLPLLTFEQYIVTSPKLHGVTLRAKHTVQLDKAWIG